MSRANDISQASAAAQAIDRVLGAETAAQASLAQAGALAHETLERAREDARADLNRAQDRIKLWQQRHAVKLEQRLADLRAQAAASAHDLQPPDAGVIAIAVAQLAAQLTGGAADGEARHGRP